MAPRTDPAASTSARVAHDQRHDVATTCAECDAHAKLAGSFADRERRGGVDADPGEDDRQRAEQPEDRRAHPPRARLHVDEISERRYRDVRQFGRDAADRGGDCRHRVLGHGRRADQEQLGHGFAVFAEWHEELRVELCVAQRPAPRRFDDADDLAARIVPEQHTLPHRLSAGEESRAPASSLSTIALPLATSLGVNVRPWMKRRPTASKYSGVTETDEWQQFDRSAAECRSHGDHGAATNADQNVPDRAAARCTSGTCRRRSSMRS